MRIVHKRAHHNPKLRMSTVLKIERLEARIKALIYADEFAYDRDDFRRRRVVDGMLRTSTGSIDGRSRQARERKAMEAANPTPPPALMPDAEFRAKRLVFYRLRVKLNLPLNAEQQADFEQLEASEPVAQSPAVA